MKQNTKVLIIEDEDPLRMALSDALRAEGYSTMEAADGNQGYELASSQNPDLILLDLMLPGRNGFSVLKGVRRAHEKVLAATLDDHVYRTIAELFGKEDGYCKGRGGGRPEVGLNTGRKKSRPEAAWESWEDDFDL